MSNLIYRNLKDILSCWQCFHETSFVHTVAVFDLKKKKTVIHNILGLDINSVASKSPLLNYIAITGRWVPESILPDHTDSTYSSLLRIWLLIWIRLHSGRLFILDYIITELFFSNTSVTVTISLIFPSGFYTMLLHPFFF